jgi:hypothetical protein
LRRWCRPPPAQAAIELEALHIAGELFDAIDLSMSLDLDRHGSTLGIAALRVERTDVGRGLAFDQTQAVDQDGGIGDQQLLEMRFDSVSLQASINTERWSWSPSGPTVGSTCTTAT